MGRHKSDLTGMKPLTREEAIVARAEIKRIAEERRIGLRSSALRSALNKLCILATGTARSDIGFSGRKRVVDFLSPDLSNLEDREYVYARVFGSDFCPVHPFYAYLFHSSFDSVSACVRAAARGRVISSKLLREPYAVKRDVASAFGAGVTSVFPETSKLGRLGMGDGSTRFSRFLRTGGTTVQTLASELGVSAVSVYSLLNAGKGGMPKFAEYSYLMRRIARCFHKTVQSLFADIVKKPSIRRGQRSKLLRVLANPENVNRLKSVMPAGTINHLRYQTGINPYYFPRAATRRLVCDTLKLSEASIWPPSLAASYAAISTLSYSRCARVRLERAFAQKQKE